MSGTRGGLGRIVAMGIGLAVALLLALAAEARASPYTVAQCGWYVGADAAWADTTGGAKFRPDAFCVPPGGGDPFAGSHLKSFTRQGAGTVSGNRYARWRWTAPAGTAITNVRGFWWFTLHDGIEQRIGSIDAAGNFAPFGIANSTYTTPREFAGGFVPAVVAFEDRLLCARAESKWCSLSPGSWSGLRALTFTVADYSPPAAGIGGDLVAGGWRRGDQLVAIWGGDMGSGIRYGDTYIDGHPAARTEYPCAAALIDGQWRGTRMQPCALGVSSHQAIATAKFSDGAHPVMHCVFGFDGDAGCTAVHTVHIDNNPPAQPQAIELAGGAGWRRTNDFDLGWRNPGQGNGSAIAGAGWRLTGPGGFDGGARYAAGVGRRSLSDLRVPAAGSHTLRLWLRDEAGNEAPSAAAVVSLHFDDLAPSVAFAPGDPTLAPPAIVASVVDAHSGPASGAISFRRADADQWRELATKLVRGAAAGSAELRAPTPELAPGTYLFRAAVTDGAGNSRSSSLRSDGTRMEIRVAPPAPVAPVAAAVRVPGAKTRLFARLRGGHGRGESLTVAFGAAALLGGRLTRADGAGIAGRELRVVSRPSRGALARATVATVRTGARGGFELRLAPGPSRRLAVSFDGAGGLDPSRRRPLELRVRAGLALHAPRTRLRTGEVLRLRGRVRGRGAAIPRRGKLVAIQYLEQATGRWRPVLVTRSDHHGRFRARYRFRYLSGSARVRLRATALAEERWPYAPGSSHPVTVDVRAR